MKILVATGIFPPQIGGPAIYAKRLSEEFLTMGHSITVKTYGWETKLPTGIRHLYYLLKIIPAYLSADFIIALDNFSVGLPVAILTKIFGKKSVIRTGGDFLWENYSERTGDQIPLSRFYQNLPIFTKKEKIIYSWTKFLMKNITAIIFSTAWQRDISVPAYGLDNERIFIIENCFEKRGEPVDYDKKNFLWAGRDIKIKNVKALKAAFGKIPASAGLQLDLYTKLSQEELLEKIKKSYAVILPSITDISPNFILDAIGCGVPFIMTKESGYADKLKDLGLLIDPLDEQDILNKIMLMSDQNKRAEFAQRISQYKEFHSYRDIAEEFLVIYKKI
jgi:hypothetical protein